MSPQIAQHHLDKYTNDLINIKTVSPTYKDVSGMNDTKYLHKSSTSLNDKFKKNTQQTLYTGRDAEYRFMISAILPLNKLTHFHK